MGGKKAPAYSKLILTRDRGGYGLPDILLFTQSTHFRYISDWFLKRSTFSNYELELALFMPYSPSALLHTPRNVIPQSVLSNVLFEGTYSSWCAINKHLCRSHTDSEYTTLWGNPCFLPGMDNPRFRLWGDKGISAIKDVFDPGGTIHSFTHLKDTYDLPNRDFYMYLQVRHFAQSLQIPELGNNTKNAFSETMAWVKIRQFKNRFLYPELLEPLVDKAWENSYKSWSLDIPTLCSSKIWLDCCAFTLKHLSSAALQETHLKTLQRAYFSPSQRKHMVPDENGRCKKCTATDATFFHCFWDCSKIKRFWDKVLNYINTVLSLKLVKHPISCLFLNFSDWDLGPLAAQIRPLLVVVLTVAKQCILFHWIGRSPPSLHEVKSRLLDILYYERQKVFPDVEKGVYPFYRKWGLYIIRLSQDTQDQIQKVFESTTWYLSRQVM